MAAPGFAPLIINLCRKVVEHLSREVWRNSIPSQGMEIGGLLLGTAARETRVIEIEDFEPIAWNGRPERFVLSESECRALKTTLATRAWLRDSKLNVVGCYRSHVGEGFSLTADDLVFAQSCIQGPSGVFLLIKPSSGGTLTAALFSWGNGQIDSEYTFQEFPFDVHQLADEPAETCEPRVSEDAKTAQPIADRTVVERSFPAAFSEKKTKPTKKVAVRVPTWRYRRRVWRAAALLARTRALWKVQTFLRRTRAFPWQARTLQVLGYPFAVARAASRQVRTRVGQAGVLVHRAFLAPVRTFLGQIRAFPWRARILLVLGYSFAMARATSRRVRTRVGQAGALVHRAFLAPVQTFLLRARAFPWQAHALREIGYLIAVSRAISRGVLTRAGAFINQSLLAPARASLSRTRTFPWWVRGLRVVWYSYAALIIVMAVLGYRVYLSQVGSRASAKVQMISGRPSNMNRSQLEVLAMPVVRSAQTSAARSLVTSGRNAAPLKRAAATGHRARRKPRVSSGKQPPFTCSPGDVFHKTDAAPGWDTFTCRGKNVWSITRSLDRL
jgi:hypothetical protein